MKNRLMFAGFGVLATVVGMATGHLVASLLDPASSPILAVGSTVIDLTPTPMKEWAIAQFGTKDKTILVGSVFLGALILAAIGGILARRRFAIGASLLLLLVALSGAAAMLRPTSGVLDLVPALGTAIAGVAALALLVRLAGESTGVTAVDRRFGLGDSAADAGPSRRGLLIAAGVLTAAAAVMAGAGRWITGLRTSPTDVTLPAAKDAAAAFPQGLENKVKGISPFRTPISDFYRVDTRLTLPIIGLDDYTLTIDGDVDEEVTFTFEDLLAMDLIERDITITCVSNDVGGPYVGSARWTGVPLKALLDRAGVGDKADQILSTDVDGMTISTPLAMAMDGRDAMVAVGMNGQALPREHGFPVRMVIPGLYGFISATKWMTRITLTTYAEDKAYWTERDWAIDAPIKISSRIDTPKSFEEIDAGDTFIGGVAWAQTQGIGGVEVQIDGGQWEKAELGPSAGDDYWIQWYLPWKAESGEHTVGVRATTKDGDVQTAAKTMPFPEGSSGLQKIIVRVT